MKKSVAPELEPEAEKALLSSLNAQTNALYKATEKLEAVLKGCDAGADMLARARYTRDHVIAAMNEVRARRRRSGGHRGQELLADAHLPGFAHERVRRRERFETPIVLRIDAKKAPAVLLLRTCRGFFRSVENSVQHAKAGCWQKEGFTIRHLLV